MPRAHRDDDSGEYDAPPHKKKPVNANTVLLAIVAVVVVGVVAGCGGLMLLFFWGSAKSAQQQAEKIASMKYTPIDAGEFIDEWAANPAAAQAKYANTGVEITAKLKRISGSDTNTRFELEDSQGRFLKEINVRAETEKTRAGLKKCKVGEMVRILAHADTFTYQNPDLIADDVRPVGQ